MKKYFVLILLFVPLCGFDSVICMEDSEETASVMSISDGSSGRLPLADITHLFVKIPKSTTSVSPSLPFPPQSTLSSHASAVSILSNPDDFFIFGPADKKMCSEWDVAEREPYIFQFLRKLNFNENELIKIIYEEPGMLLLRNSDGLTPLHYLICGGLYNPEKRKNVIKRLFIALCDMERGLYFENIAEFVKEVLNAKIEKTGYTPLHVAVSAACLNSFRLGTLFKDIINILINNKHTDINALTNNHETALDRALYYALNPKKIKLPLFESSLDYYAYNICKLLVAHGGELGVDVLAQSQGIERMVVDGDLSPKEKLILQIKQELQVEANIAANHEAHSKTQIFEDGKMDVAASAEQAADPEMAKLMLKWLKEMR